MVKLIANDSTKDGESIQASNIVGLAAGVDANDAGKITKTVNSNNTQTKTKNDRPLGITVHALREVLLPEVKQAGLHETSTIDEIEDLIRKKGAEITCPREGIIGAAYVDCLNGINNVGPYKQMLSYTLGDSIGDIIDSLDAYCESNNEDPKKMYIWICCLCNNLHLNVKYSPSRESKFQDAVVDIGHGLDEMLVKLTDVKYIDLVKSLMLPKISTIKALKDNDESTNIKLVKTDIRASTLNKNVKTPLQEYVLDKILALVDECEQQSVYPEIDLEYAKLCDDVGRIMHQYGKYDEAILRYNKCLAVFKKVCGEDHVDTARSYSNIGSVMLYKCDYDKALDMFRKCLKVKEKIYGVEHYDTATTYNNIALVMMITSDYHGALAMFEKALAVDEKLCGKKHPDTATSYNNIGVMKNKMGDLDGAILMYKKCLAVEKEFYGKDYHEKTKNSHNNISTALVKKCNLLVEKHGENHEDVLKIKSEIAEIKKALG